MSSACNQLAVFCEDNWEESPEKISRVLCFTRLFKEPCLCDGPVRDIRECVSVQVWGEACQPISGTSVPLCIYTSAMVLGM